MFLVKDPHLIGRFERGFAFVKDAGFRVENTRRIKPKMFDHKRIHGLAF